MDIYFLFPPNNNPVTKPPVLRRYLDLFLEEGGDISIPHKSSSEYNKAYIAMKIAKYIIIVPNT